MASQPTLHRTEGDYRLAYKKIDAIVTITKKAMVCSAAVAIAYFAYKSIAVLAGKTTLASIWLKILANVTVHESVYIVVTGGCIIWALGERALRRRTIKHLAPRVKELEEIIHRGRTSSGLTALGTTRPEDKI